VGLAMEFFYVLAVWLGLEIDIAGHEWLADNQE
jgi:hypothetical protein